MNQKTCSNCKHYTPEEDTDLWGVCSANGLWPVGNQEVEGDIHACKERGSQWSPITMDSAPYNSDILNSFQDSQISPEIFIWGGVIGLIFSGISFLADMVIGIPLFPEITCFFLPITIPVSIAAIYIGKSKLKELH